MHIILQVEKVNDNQYYEVSIALGDDSKIDAAVQGVRRVRWQSDYRPVSVNLSNTLEAPDVAISQLSGTDLISKGLDVLLAPGKALIIIIREDCYVIGYA